MRFGGLNHRWLGSAGLLALVMALVVGARGMAAEPAGGGTVGAPETKKAVALASGPAQPAQNLSAAKIDALIKQLDDDEFARREAASRQLEEAGPAAVEGLGRVVTGQSLEATTRAFAILKKFLASRDAATQAAAREALQKIAVERDSAGKKGNDQLVAAAARAQNILDEAGRPAQFSSNGPFPGGARVFPMPGRAINGGNIIINGGRLVVGGAGRNTRLSIRSSVTDGVRQVDVDESLGANEQRRVHIVTDQKVGIKLEVTTTKAGGPEKTEKYEARDAETLKKEHPDAFKIYDRFGGAGIKLGGIQVVGGRIDIREAPAALPDINEIGKLNEKLRKFTDELRKFEVEHAAHGGIDQSPPALEDLRRQVERDANRAAGQGK